ncbi:glycosyltransferase [Sphingobium amiense]|uniref:Glycosyltransferase n=1 Tax=Sphingobium amiense TaxID=135719 RepID=A0A494W4Q0_9SPHN|nr:glycosyltransferase [Sphingobium amiense]BBD98306.1 glycosyltransferase [Sphingobium amiense]
MFQYGGPEGSRPFVAIYLYQPGDGGLDRVAILLANHLLRRRIPVELWMTRLEGPAAHLIDPDVPVRQVKAPRMARRLSMIAQYPRLAAMVRRHRPDILYSAGNQSNMLVALACRGTPTKAVARISNPIVHAGKHRLPTLARLSRFRAISRISDLTIVMGAHDRDLLEATGPVRLLPRPTVTPAMARIGASRKGRCPDAPWRLLMVGRLAKQKDHATGLAALARLRHIDWRLTIAGQGPLEASLRDRSESLGIADRVTFAGYVGDPDALAALMGESDILLQPSCWEGLGATLIEALSCGTQVVSTDCTPNIRPIMAAAAQHPVVPVGDAAAFARAVERTMAHPVAPERLTAAVRDHGVERALDHYLHAFRTLVGIQANATPIASPVLIR